MKQVLIHLFCLSIIFQSVLGQFLFWDYSNASYVTSSTVVLSFSDKNDADHTHYNIANESDPSKENTLENQIPENSNAGRLRFVRDSVVEHLFSPSKCPNETTHVLTIFSFLYIKDSINLFVIEEKISTFVHFYASLFRKIEIGLPVTKLIYPFHNFY